MYIIGVAGASGSGKTLLCETLVHQLQDELGATHVGLIKEDNYYKDLTHLPISERKVQNFDHPDLLDHKLLFSHLKKLKKNESIEIPNYDFHNYTRATTTVRLMPPKILFVEGILTLHNKKLRKAMSLRVFVNTPLDISFIRRLNRDIHERGRTAEEVIRQYTETARPMYYRYVKPSQEYADLIVPHGGQNYPAIELLKAHIRETYLKNSHP